MSANVDQVAAQLSRELGAAAWDLGSLVSPDEAIEWQRRVTQAGQNLALSICSGGDAEAAQAVNGVLGVLWPKCSPEDSDPDWWRTPLGRACAASLGLDSAERVSYSVAGAMLGITEASAKKAVQRGQIDRHPDGGVVRASVLQRIAAQGARS